MALSRGGIFRQRCFPRLICEQGSCKETDVVFIPWTQISFSSLSVTRAALFYQGKRISSAVSIFLAFSQPDYTVPRLLEIYWQPLSQGHLTITDKNVGSQWCPLRRGSTVYRIAGNFQGRKPSRISLFCCGCLQKFSLQNLGVWHPLAWHKRAIRESFLHENHIFHQFTKLFSLESFPLYSSSLEETEDKEACVRGENGWRLPVKMYRWWDLLPHEGEVGLLNKNLLETVHHS